LRSYPHWARPICAQRWKSHGVTQAPSNGSENDAPVQKNYIAFRLAPDIDSRKPRISPHKRAF
jgi:hypothetical protein